METTTLGSSDVTVTRVGLGCMSLGTDPERAHAVVGAALEAGITHFDTADLYDAGENERLLGAALREHGARGRVTVATKAGNERRADGSGWDWNPDPDYLERALHASLERLGRDRVDLFQLHGGTVDDPVDAVVARFEKLQDEGVIGAYGISSIRPNTVRAWLERAPRLASVQLQLSLLDRRAEEEILPRLAEAGVAAIVRGPVAKGLLVSKAPAPYLEHEAAAVASAAGAVRAVAAAEDGGSGERTPARVAIRWTLERPAVALAIPGASSPAQALDNAGAAAVELSSEEVRRLTESAPALHYSQHR